MLQRSSFEIKKGLLKKAFQENRGAATIARILERVHRVRDATTGGKQVMAKFEILNGLQPRSVRAHNYLQDLEGKTNYILDPKAYALHIKRN